MVTIFIFDGMTLQTSHNQVGFSAGTDDRDRYMIHRLFSKHGARVRFLLGTIVKTAFLQALTSEFGHSAREQGLHLVLRQ